MNTAWSEVVKKITKPAVKCVYSFQCDLPSSALMTWTAIEKEIMVRMAAVRFKARWSWNQKLSEKPAFTSSLRSIEDPIASGISRA